MWVLSFKLPDVALILGEAASTTLSQLRSTRPAVSRRLRAGLVLSLLCPLAQVSFVNAADPAGVPADPAVRTDGQLFGEDRAVLNRRPDKILTPSGAEVDRPVSRSAQLAPQFGLGAGLVPLTIVLVSIVAVAWCARRFLFKHRLGTAVGLHVISRTALSSKQSVALIRLGKRVLVVGITPDHISALANVDDPVEVDLLTADAGKAPARTDPFDGLLRREGDAFDPQDPGSREPVVPSIRRTSQDVRALRDKVRGLTEAVGTG